MFKTVLTAVQDLDAAKATWSALLGEPTNDAPRALPCLITWG
jgi:hypothetical protein